MKRFIAINTTFSIKYKIYIKGGTTYSFHTYIYSIHLHTEHKMNRKKLFKKIQKQHTQHKRVREEKLVNDAV